MIDFKSEYTVFRTANDKVNQLSHSKRFRDITANAWYLHDQ